MSDRVAYFQFYHIGVDEFLNVAFTGDLPDHCDEAYADPVPWRRMFNRDTKVIDDAPEPNWHNRDANEMTNLAAKLAWFNAHPNIAKIKEDPDV